MVETFLRLRLRLLYNTLRRDTWRLVLLILGGVWALSLVPLLLAGAVWLRAQPVAVAHDVIIVAGALLLLGWVTLPVLMFGSDETVDPTKFATFAVPRRPLVVGLLAAGLISLPALLTALIAALVTVTWSGAGTLATVVSLAAAPITVLLCIVSARISTTAAARALGSRRGKEAAGLVFVVALVAVGPAIFTFDIATLDEFLAYLPGVANFLSWTPIGLTWAAPADVAGGYVLRGILRLLLAIAVLVFMLWLWGVLLHRTRTTAAVSSGQAHAERLAKSAGRWWMPRDNTTAIIAARSARYWRTDPRYLTSMLGIVVMPIVIIALLSGVLDGNKAVLLFTAPMMAGMAGWGIHNDLAHDGSAFWLHITAAVSGRADRTGRTWATGLWVIPCVVLAAVASVLAAERPGVLPAILGACAALLLIGWAVSAVVSVSLPYPAPQAGDNPFATQSGSAAITMGAQFVSSAVTFTLCLPVSVLAVVGVVGPHWAGWLALLLGLSLGCVALHFGHRIGGAQLELRRSDLLLKLRTWTA